MLAELVLWTSVAWVTYVYIGYPVCVALLARVLGKPVAKDDRFLPRVTVLIPAYNEEACLAATIQNKLEQDYPPEKLEIVVISDESTDGTDAIAASFAGSGVRLVRQEPRRGKTSGLNLAVPDATGEILVFSDANSIHAPDAIRRLVANFADPQVGYVTGKMIYVNPDGSPVGDGCSAYMRYENRLRGFETRVGSVVGVDGGVDAVRRSLYRPMAPDQLPDFVLPLDVVRQGYRVVYEPAAELREDLLSSAGSEYRMRVRVSLRALWALNDLRELLSPGRYGVYAWQLWSHKLLRYLAFVPLLLAFASNLALLGRPSLNLLLLLLLQTAFYAAAALVHFRPGLSEAFRPLAFPHYFVLLNTACAHAVWKYLRGEKIGVWKPRAA